MRKDSIPKVLQELQRWVCFDADKHPVNPRTGQNAKPNDPGTWADLDTALAAVSGFGCRGIGFMLGGGVAGIDIDHCIGPDGKISEMAQDIVDTMQTYTERSPSGTGLHLLWLGHKPEGSCRSTKLGLEMYDHDRYFTFTGNRFTPGMELTDGTERAAAVHQKYLAKAQPQSHEPIPQRQIADEAALLQKARDGRDGERFSALMAGDWSSYYASHSEADLGLCNLLAFWLGCNQDAMDRAFRSSGLMREKWDQRRGGQTYGQRTLKRACDDCQTVYSPPEAHGTFADAETFFANRAAAPDEKPAPGKKQYSLDDTGNARRFADEYGTDVRFNPIDGCWMVWNGQVWKRDDISAVKRRADEMLDRMEKGLFGLRDPDAAKALRLHIQKSRSSRGKEAFLKEVRHLPGIPVLPAQLNAKTGLLCVQNGVVDLASGTLRPFCREDYITRQAGVCFDKAAPCPVWRAFLQSITGGDQALQEYLQCMVGYMLSGSIREQCIFFLFGSGSNGKSTFLEALDVLFGEYAMNTQADTITSTRTASSSGPRTDIARLKGARLVTVSESDEGVYLDESLVKQLTGGDTVTARFLYGKEFEFKPDFKIVMATNHKPRIRGTDEGIWRRIRLIPFVQHIPESQQDLQLPEKLRAEGSGILSWALEGLAKWLRNSQGGKRRGLPACKAVSDATNDYKTEQDRARIFLLACTTPAPGQSVAAGLLYKIYQIWARENGERAVMSNNRFGREIGRLCEKQVGRTCAEYMDLTLTDDGRRYMAWTLSGNAQKTRPEPLCEQIRMPKC